MALRRGPAQAARSRRRWTWARWWRKRTAMDTASGADGWRASEGSRAVEPLLRARARRRVRRGRAVVERPACAAFDDWRRSTRRCCSCPRRAAEILLSRREGHKMRAREGEGEGDPTRAGGVGRQRRTSTPRPLLPDADARFYFYQTRYTVWRTLPAPLLPPETPGMACGPAETMATLGARAPAPRTPAHPVPGACSESSDGDHTHTKQRTIVARASRRASAPHPAPVVELASATRPGAAQ